MDLRLPHLPRASTALSSVRAAGRCLGQHRQHPPLADHLTGRGHPSCEFLTGRGHPSCEHLIGRGHPSWHPLWLRPRCWVRRGVLAVKEEDHAGRHNNLTR